MAHIIITGGTGFLGSTAAEYFANKGNSVTILGRDENKGYALEKKNIRFIKMDLSEKDALEKLIQHGGFEYLVHAAAKSTLWGRYEDFRKANVEGTFNVMKAASHAKIKRVVHISSPSIYTQFSDCYNIQENDLLPKPINNYAKTKLESEKIVQDAINNEGLDAIILRPRAIFGPGDNAILPRLLKAGEKGIPLIDHRSPLIDATYVDNVVFAIELGLFKENIPSRVYNITNDDSRPIHEFISQAFKLVGKKYFERHISRQGARAVSSVVETFHNMFLPEKEPAITSYGICLFSNAQTMDITRAKKELGYTPKISIDEGLSIYAKWYKEHEH